MDIIVRHKTIFSMLIFRLMINNDNGGSDDDQFSKEGMVGCWWYQWPGPLTR